MYIEEKKRLRGLISSLGISNLEIAQKTGYTTGMVSLSLNPKKEVLTDKFLRKFFDAFPEIKEQYREYILEGTGGDGNTLFTSTAKTNDTEAKLHLQVLTKENQMLKDEITGLKGELNWFKTMLERAFQIQPDLQGKLLSPLTENGKTDFIKPVMPLGGFARDYANA